MTPNSVKTVARQTGIALWRQIADRIRASISSGDFDATGILPAETALAEQFGVNRHTVRSALTALAQEGIVNAVQGRGTMIARRQRLNFPISKRTRFTAGIGDQARDVQGLLLSAGVEPASGEIALRLDVKKDAQILRIEAVRKADGQPVSVSTSWFPLPRFAGMEEAYRQTGSITQAFALCGLSDYLRVSTEITAAHGEPRDLMALGLSPGAIVLVTTALNADPDGIPVQFAVTRFPADRVQLTVNS